MVVSIVIIIIIVGSSFRTRIKFHFDDMNRIRICNRLIENPNPKWIGLNVTLDLSYFDIVVVVLLLLWIKIERNFINKTRTSNFRVFQLNSVLINLRFSLPTH